MKLIHACTLGVILGVVVASSIALAADQVVQPAETKKSEEAKAPPPEEKKEVELREDRIKAFSAGRFLSTTAGSLPRLFALVLTTHFTKDWESGQREPTTWRMVSA